MSWTPTYHKRNLGNLADLAPNTKAAAMKWYQYCIDNKIDVLIYETIRTVAQQRENVRNGASKTMKSYHLVGQALDFVPMKNGKALWARSEYGKRPFIDAIRYAEKIGFESGYRWGWDAPHLQYNYKGYGTDKYLTATAAVPVNTLSKDEVKALQEKLAKLGLDTNGIDGIYGKGTTNAVMILQRRTGLAIDGIAGKATLEKIDQLIKEKGLVGTPGKFRVYTGVFGTHEKAEAAAKEIGFNAFAKDLRAWTGIFTSLEAAEEACAVISGKYGYNPKIRKE
ncbi:peptidoglycan-binding protein [Bacillus badius]|uniref:peptidoglycan-binding protein n=1 Tax=Bacillus badius TaxID=1455 RepID=UPI00069867E8|nr:peptidoglycan-binding protein [Bacillus badius]